MIEGSARARLGRAMNTRTTMAAEHLGLQVGQEVEFFRSPGTKDTPGWHGPAEVVDIGRQSRGVVTVRHNNRLHEVQVANIRRIVLLVTLLFTSSKEHLVYTAHVNVWGHLKQSVEQIPQGTVKHFGEIRSKDHQLSAASNSKFPGLMSAVRFFGENHLQLSNMVSARIGRGIRKLHALRGYVASTLVL